MAAYNELSHCYVTDRQHIHAHTHTHTHTHMYVHARTRTQMYMYSTLSTPWTELFFTLQLKCHKGIWQAQQLLGYACIAHCWQQPIQLTCVPYCRWCKHFLGKGMPGGVNSISQSSETPPHNIPWYWVHNSLDNKWTSKAG